MCRRTLMTRAALLLATLLLAAAPAALGQEYATGEEVMDAVDARPAPAAMTSTMTMTITTRSGQSLTRTMQIWTADGGDREVVKFTAPADIKGSGFLSVTNPDGSSEAMVYLPALGRVRRIAGGQKQESFFGSDFSYEDITELQGGTKDQYDHALVEVRPGPIYVVRSTARAGTGASYDQLVLEIPEDTLLPTKVEFYRGAALLKVMTIERTDEVDGFVLPARLHMETEASGSSTTIEQTEVEVASAIPDEVFTERFLRR